MKAILAPPPRTGIWLAERFHLIRKNVLEIAGGSCRDSRYISELGIKATGTDFDEKTLQYLHKRFPSSRLNLRKEDAFNTSFPNNSFDLVFHNGFFIYFNDDQKVYDLLREQIRISRKYIVALVHNYLNKDLVQQFAEKAKQDSLYDIRFFSPCDLEYLIQTYNIKFSSVRIEKFGGPIDRLYRFAKPPLKKIAYSLIPRLYRFQPWSKVERIALILKK